LKPDLRLREWHWLKIENWSAHFEPSMNIAVHDVVIYRNSRLSGATQTKFPFWSRAKIMQLSLTLGLAMKIILLAADYPANLFRR